MIGLVFDDEGALMITLPPIVTVVATELVVGATISHSLLVKRRMIPSIKEYPEYEIAENVYSPLLSKDVNVLPSSQTKPMESLTSFPSNALNERK